jgi:hypothetical protein
LLSIRPVRSGAPHAKNNAKAVPKDLTVILQQVNSSRQSRRTTFGIFLTAQA